jgi:hypothetical protein
MAFCFKIRNSFEYLKPYFMLDFHKTCCYVRLLVEVQYVYCYL